MEEERGIVKKGNEEGMKLILSVMEEFGVPSGLLRLADVVEAGFERATGYVWVRQKKKTEHTFKLANKLVSYDAEITGYMEPRKIRDVRGIRAKELFMWPPVREVAVGDPLSGEIQVKSFAGITKSYPVEAFAAGQ